jgi:hypothetical protein
MLLKAWRAPLLSTSTMVYRLHKCWYFDWALLWETKASTKPIPGNHAEKKFLVGLGVVGIMHLNRNYPQLHRVLPSSSTSMNGSWHTLGLFGILALMPDTNSEKLSYN